MDQIIATLASASATVSAEHAASVAATADATTAEAELLARVVEAVRPALAALSTKIRESSAASGGRDGCHPWSETTYHRDATGFTRGLLVAGDDGPTQATRGDDTTGRYEGTALYLLTDGTFAEVEYSGTWSRWQGATSKWETGLLRISDLTTIAREWDVDEIVASLSKALDSAKGSRAKAIAKAKDRAERMRALAALLGGKS